MTTDKQALRASCKKHCRTVLSGKLFHTRVHSITAFLPMPGMTNIYCASYDRSTSRERERQRMARKGASFTASLLFSSSLFLTNTHQHPNLNYRGTLNPPPPSNIRLLTGVVAGGFAGFCPSALDSRSLGGVCPRGSIVLNGSIHKYQEKKNDDLLAIYKCLTCVERGIKSMFVMSFFGEKNIAGVRE